MKGSNRVLRENLINLIKIISPENVSEIAIFVKTLHQKKTNSHEVNRRNSESKVTGSSPSEFEKLVREKKVLEGKLCTAVSFVKSCLKQKNRLIARVEHSKDSCYMYERKIEVLSSRLREWMKFNKRSAAIMIRVRNRYKAEVKRRKGSEEELRKVKILAELEDEVPEPKMVKKQEEELFTPSPPVPSIFGLDEFLKKKEEERIIGNQPKEEEESSTTKEPSPPPPLIMTTPPPLPPGVPPPPPMIIVTPTTQDNSPDWALTPKKASKTVSVRVGKIAKRRLSRSVFQKEQLLRKGHDKYWNENVAFLLQEKFKFRPRSHSNPQGLNPKYLKHGRPRSKSTVVSLVDNQKSLNSAIVCGKIEEKDFVLNCLRKSAEWCYKEGKETISRVFQITSIYSTEEKEKIIEKSKNESEEHIKVNYSPGDQFIISLFQIPSLDIKLHIFEFIESHQEMIFGVLKPELEMYFSLIQRVRDSEKFRSFLSLVLVITNFLNQEEIEEEDDEAEEGEEENRSAPVLGISVRSLVNLARVKNSENPKENLMDVIYGILCEEHADVLDFKESFADVGDIVRQSELGDKRTSFKKFKDCLAKLQYTHLVQLKKDLEVGVLEEDDQIIPTLENLLPRLEEEVKSIQNKFNEIEELIQTVSDYYGFPKESVHEWLVDLNDVMVLLEKTKKKREDSIRRGERREKRRKLMEERMEQKKRLEEQKMKEVLNNLENMMNDETSTTSDSNSFLSIPNTPVEDEDMPFIRRQNDRWMRRSGSFDFDAEEEEEEEGEDQWNLLEEDDWEKSLSEEYEITNLYDSGSLRIRKANEDEKHSVTVRLENFREQLLKNKEKEEDQQQQQEKEVEQEKEVLVENERKEEEERRKQQTLELKRSVSVPKLVKVSKKRIKKISNILSVFRRKKDKKKKKKKKKK